ncbi:MAG: PfkB family carbohydrate kinase [Spirochaetia bacterium]|jgi:pseudouridine kinase|nr:PfkB family carbohydrate kinase [Spirochaetia bacterium]
MITEREKEILRLVKENPLISQAEIAQRAGIKRSSVAVHISNLMKKGAILGKGYVLPEYPYVSVIGGVNMDILGSTEHPLIAHDSNPGHIEMSPGGAGRNQAENLCLLGIQTKFMTVFGDDVNAEKIHGSCREVGMDTSGSIVVPNGRTSMYISVIGKDGKLQYGISDMEAMEELSPAIIKSRMPVINKSCACVVESNLSEAALAYIAGNCKVPVFAETVSSTKAKKLCRILDKLYALRANAEDLQSLIGKKAIDRKTVEASVRLLVGKGVQHVYVTLGQEMVCYGDKNQILTVISKAVPIVNLTGTRDSFSAALVWAFINGFSVEKTVVAALTSACICADGRGAVNQSLTEEKLLALMKQKEADGSFSFSG